ncbi:threonine dehydrogenase-like Zn-dependent dehydrogenase [Trinickia symbiotica]|uniref:Glutathione-dependent formaldehyde dehydrogenase n=1 Tax=Trinickia symbiotica TaxID=863227 RepID=A0A2N7X2M6_9BURK|nr:zinc-dependent alcohol dehydrogenase [Trinickia symbiotica]PMS35831.1 glutathione-dependent formaldehyde dehydrogenase [Trinickia symbiotica]PPK44529.1 threonine dehydrogenase-like Zn-dependent dehydrogenase [Trinickia symbiotica]
MKAVVFHGLGDIRLDTVPDPTIEAPTDAVVRITSSAICGTDLHMVRGTLAGMKPGTILGHEGVGIVEAVGAKVRNFANGDRVLIPSTISCGYCAYCRSGYTAQCDNANPNGRLAGTAFFGGPAPSGPFNGLQAQYARTPLANASLIRLPDEIDDDRAILMSDIFPTGWFGAQLANVRVGDTVAVFGAGPVGQFAIASAKLMGAGRIFAVDRLESRLAMARVQGADPIDFDREDPVEAIRELTGGIGVDRVIDAVGVDAERAQRGPAVNGHGGQSFDAELEQVAPQRASGADNQDGRWRPGSGPSQALQWSIKAVAKAGTIGIIGVYPPSMTSFPIGEAMNRNLDIRMGNCNHRAITPHLVELVRNGTVDPIGILTQREPIADAIEAYKAFDAREPGWMKVKLEP